MSINSFVFPTRKCFFFKNCWLYVKKIYICANKITIKARCILIKKNKKKTYKPFFFSF